MDDLVKSLQENWPFLAMISLIIAQRLIVQSSLRYLSDAQKVTLVNATQKNKWAYLIFMMAFGMLFINVILGGVAIALYLVSVLVINYAWATKNDFPSQYRYRVLLGNLVLLVGIATIALFTL